MVVHREAEQHAEQEQRDPGLDGVDLHEPEQTGAVALLHHEHQQAVGGADRQQVHRDRDHRHHDAAEGDQQHDERQGEHDPDHDREVLVDDVEVVGVLRGVAADRARGDVAQVPHGGDGRLARGRCVHRHVEHALVQHGLAEARVAGDRGADRARLGGVRDRDPGGGDAADREVACQHVVGLLRLEAGGHASRRRRRRSGSTSTGSRRRRAPRPCRPATAPAGA